MRCRWAFHVLFVAHVLEVSGTCGPGEELVDGVFLATAVQLVKRNGETGPWTVYELNYQAFISINK